MVLKLSMFVLVFFLILAQNQSWGEKEGDPSSNPFTSPLSDLSQDISKPGVQIFLNGKQYESFDEYKRAAAEDAAFEVPGSSEGAPQEKTAGGPLEPSGEHNGQQANPEVFFATPQQQEGPSAEDLLKDNGDNQDDIVQMQDMLKEYLAAHKESVQVTLDPQKVKTIVISPSTNSSAEEK